MNEELMTRREWMRSGAAWAGAGAGALMSPSSLTGSVAQDTPAARAGGLARQGPEGRDSLVGTLSTPWAAGQNRARVTRWDNDPFVIDIENRLKCICGCAHSIYVCRTTDFSCGFWQALHAKIVAQAERGVSAEQIVDEYVAEHGVQYLMAPPPRGFNLAGYFVPGVLISLVAGVMFWVLKRRTALAPAPTADADWSDFSEAERERLEEELRTLDT